MIIVLTVQPIEDIPNIRAYVKYINNTYTIYYIISKLALSVFTYVNSTTEHRLLDDIVHLRDVLWTCSAVTWHTLKDFMILTSESTPNFSLLNCKFACFSFSIVVSCRWYGPVILWVFEYRSSYQRGPTTSQCFKSSAAPVS